MSTITHVFVSAKPDAADTTLVRPSNWNANHQLVYQIDNITGAAALLITDDVVRLQTGSYTVTVPLATGSGHQIYVCQDGAGTIVLARSGADTIGGRTSFTLSAVGQSCVLVDEAAGIWGLVPGGTTTTLAAAYANGLTATDQTLVLLDSEGGGVVIDGTNVGFTGASALQIYGRAGSTSFTKCDLNVIGGDLFATSGTHVVAGNLNQSDTIFHPPSGTASFTALNLAYEFDPTNTSGKINGLRIDSQSLGHIANVFNTLLINAQCVTLTGTSSFKVYANGSTAISQSASSNLTPPAALDVSTAANLNMSGGVEFVSVQFYFANISTWGTGNITTQRDFLVTASTYAFAGASTVTTGATVAITGAPTAGANATILNPLSLWVQTGTTRFDGPVGIGGIAPATTFPVSPCQLAITTTSTDDLMPGSGPGPVFLHVTSGLWGLNIGVATDNGVWMQSGDTVSAVSYPLRLNPWGGLVQINSTSPLSAASRTAFYVNLSASSNAATAVWNGFFIPNATYDYSGAATTTATLSAIFWNGGVLTYSGGSSWTITDSYVLRIPAFSFSGCTGTRTWSLQLAGNLQLQGGVQCKTKQVTSTPYTVLGQPGGSTTPTSGDCVLQVTNAAATSLNLPKISVVGGGWIIPVVDSRYNAGTNNITLVPNGTDTINNVAANFLLTYNGQSVWLISNGTTNNWEFLAYQPNVTVGGVGEMYEYANATPLVIDQVNTYHPIWTASVTAGVLDGFTFVAGVDSTYSAVTNPGGGQISFTVPAGHGMVAGQIFCVTSASVAGYRPPNPTIFVVQSVSATTIVVNGTFTATATGTWNRGASLVAGASAAGKYNLQWSATITPAAGNKDWKMEPLQNATNLDKGAQGPFRLGGGGVGAPLGGQVLVTVAAGDMFTLLINNTTDSSDVTITDLNYQLVRYQ